MNVVISKEGVKVAQKNVKECIYMAEMSGDCSGISIGVEEV